MLDKKENTKCIFAVKIKKVLINLETFQYLTENISVTMGKAKMS